MASMRLKTWGYGEYQRGNRVALDMCPHQFMKPKRTIAIVNITVGEFPPVFKYVEC